MPRDSEKTIDFYVNILGFGIKSRMEVKMPPMKEGIYLPLGGTVIHKHPYKSVKKESLGA